MVPEFDAVVFNTPKGQITAPFETEHGWHVAQVLDVKGTLPTIDSVKAQVQEAVTQEQVQEKIQPWLDEQKAKAKITNTFATEAAK
jgi:peptidyl-prolyl cis-trans isomerase SurA